VKDLRAPRGTEDILPEEIAAWRRMEEVARSLFELYGYQEIRTPIFEDTSLFVRSIGEHTDIVEKEMFSFSPAEEGSSLTLRPEATASVVRAYLEHGLHKSKKFQKLYYIGPMFRHERPQAGRGRQFHQLGVEAIGSYDPLLDVEHIILAREFFECLGLKGFKIKLNSIGCPKCRPAYRDLIKKDLEREKDNLCADCQRRLDRNVLRVLDCKEEKCKEIYARLPAFEEYICGDCAGHFAAVKEALDENGVDFTLEPHLVRGFDYYTKTVYEFVHPALGARDAICGGGRYDGLVEEIGGPPTGATGFAIGMDTTLLALKKSKATQEREKGEERRAVYIASVSEQTKHAVFALALRLRKAHIQAEMDFEGRSLKAQMRQANKQGAAVVLVVGPDELAAGEVTLKDMATGLEEKVALNEVVERLRGKQGQEKIAR